MIRRWLTVIGMTLLAGQVAAQDPLIPEDDTAQLSYAFGVNYWNMLREQAVTIDPEYYMLGFMDAATGDRVLMTESEIDSALNEFSRQQATLQAGKSSGNRQAGVAFLAENKSREGVATTASGLQYKILKAGDGDRPGINDKVVVQYRGTRLDGTEFDSSDRRDQPATFTVKQVIPGWREALQLMPVGSSWQLFIPAHLAYGERGVSGLIAPDSTLLFEVELLAIETAELKDIQASFKLDPRLTQSLYMGERWVSPPTYKGVRRVTDTYIVEARAHGVDAQGGNININPEWIASDREMVAVSPARGDAVRIVVRQPGESRLMVVTAGFTKELLINATRDGKLMQVEISQ